MGSLQYELTDTKDGGMKTTDEFSFDGDNISFEYNVSLGSKQTRHYPGDADELEITNVFMFGEEMPSEMEKKFLEKHEEDAFEYCWQDYHDTVNYYEELKAESRHEDNIIRKLER